MNQDRLWPKLAAVFVVTLAGYLAVYHFIESQRTRHSPWNVSFAADQQGDVTLEIREQSLQLGPVQIRLPAAAKNGIVLKTNVLFDSPQPFPYPTPIGECVFADLTFLPGTVVLKVGATDIQMLPKSLTIGTNALPWSGTRSLVVVSNVIQTAH
ncbi:MAG: hypothetical protein RLY20_3015 [Verrucomicrobiota bacterium]|jgi:hypothetical protein